MDNLVTDRIARTDGASGHDAESARPCPGSASAPRPARLDRFYRDGAARFAQARTIPAFALEAWTRTEYRPDVGVCKSTLADVVARPSPPTVMLR